MNFSKFILLFVQVAWTMHDHSASELNGQQWIDPTHASMIIVEFLQQARAAHPKGCCESSE